MGSSAVAVLVKQDVGPCPIRQVAEMFAWPASDPCSFTTGAAFKVSGGRSTYHQYDTPAIFARVRFLVATPPRRRHIT